MPAILDSRRVGKPLYSGRAHNAIYDGRLVWPLARDTVVSVEILTVDGGTPPSTLPINGTVTLAAKATYADGHEGEPLTGEGVVFASRTPDVATVTENTVTWVHGGTALITATIGGVTSPALELACEYAPEAISVNPESVTMRVGDDPVRVLVSVLPAQASQEFTATIKDQTIATITKKQP